MNDKPHLRHGSEWVDHEDCLVGNEAGLRRLRDACDVALRDGEYFGSDLDEFIGVKRLDSAWFEKPQDKPTTRILNNWVLPVLLMSLLGLIGVGVVTVFRWLF